MRFFGSFRLALVAFSLVAPWVVAGPPGPNWCGPDDYCPKTCPPIAACFKPGGCDFYDKKCLMVTPPVCLTGCDPYCKKPMPVVGSKCLPAAIPLEGCCPPNWFGLRKRP